MAFRVEEYAYELIGLLQPLVARIKRHNEDLADQLTRAGSSVALNVAEGNYSQGGNRRSRFFSAAASANETRAALRVAVEWKYFKLEEAAKAVELLDNIMKMLWSLTR